MSIRFKNAAGVFTASNNIMGFGRSRASVALRLRVNAPLTVTQSLYLSRNTVISMSPSTSGAPAGYFKLSLNWTPTDGAAPVNVTPGLGVVHHIAMTYDKDDPSSQAYYWNGTKSLFPARTGTLWSTPQSMGFGVGSGTTANTIDFELEGFFFLNDYILTTADVFGLIEGADPSTIGASATWRDHWPMAGTPGAVPTAGDAGLVGSIAGSLPLSTYIGTSTPGTSLLYGEPMPFVSQTTYETPVVCSSGESVRVAVKYAATGAGLAVPAGGVKTPPSIRIDGGSPITLGRVFYAGTHTGFICYMPDGGVIPKGASVAMTAVDGWFTTGSGAAAGMTDAPIVNRSGAPIYGGLPPTIRVGTNKSVGPSYWHFDRGPRNLALSIPAMPPTTFRADGTASSAVSTSFLGTNFGNAFDRTGSPMTFGWYAVGYDDNDPANPTNISLIMDDARIGVIQELTAYRNEGAGGIGKVRVFDVKWNTWNFALQGGCSDSDVTLTLDSVAALKGFTAGGLQQWIKFDDEYMAITAVNTGAKQITVTRGEFDSTPASHAANAVGLASFYTPYYSIRASISGGLAGSPNYKNLVIYAPQDWTPPASPGPATLDFSAAGLYGPGKIVLDTMANGEGVSRRMDSCMGGFDFGSEPEHLRLDSDRFPSRDVKYQVALRNASSRAVNPANVPYDYSPIPTIGSEKYTVTLGADITTSPPAGTVETVTITGARAAGVFAHQRLEFPSGEVVRVLSASGDAVDVARGSDRTTPAPQAAGPILCRYRTPITSSSQYEQDGIAWVEVTTDQDHGLWSNVWAHTQTNADLSLLARINITLTADVTSTTQAVFGVSVAGPDALYLAPGLEIMFDSEIVRVAAYDPIAGTIDVLVTNGVRGQRGTTAATHASGTVGVGRSGGVFCVSNDGTQYGWSSNIGFGTYWRVTGPNKLISPYAGGGVGGSQPWQHVGEQTWDVTPTPVGLNNADTTLTTFTTPISAYSYEYHARETAHSPGAHHWLNIPFCATDDMVDAIARSVRDNLPTGKHKVLVELANEVWNNVIQFQPIMATTTQISGGYADPNDFFFLQSRHVADIVQAVFDEAGRGGEVKLVLAWRQGGMAYVLGRAVALGIAVDVCSTAPYFRPGTTDAHFATWDASTDGQCIDTWLFDAEYNTANIGGQLAQDGVARRAYEAATGRSLEFIHYEGGLDSCVPIPYTSLVDGRARNMDQMYHPARYCAEYDYPYVLNRVGGSDGIALFNRCQASFAASSGHDALWGLTMWYGQQPGRGDGSDGKADNTRCLVTPGRTYTKHPTVNQDATNVSVRLQAYLDYNAAYAANITPPPANADVPRRVPGRISRRQKRALQAITARTPLVSSDVPPPPQPSPVPAVGRRAMRRYSSF